MADKNGRWLRQGEAFWRAHHEAWKRSDLNQRQYCEAEGIPLKAFGNWRAKFKAEPQPPERKLLYRHRGLSHPLSPRLSHPLSHPLTWLIPPRGREAPLFRDRARVIVDGSAKWINVGLSKRRRKAAEVSQRSHAAMASTAVFYVDGSKSC
jgi:hypothetical protein